MKNVMEFLWYADDVIPISKSERGLQKCLTKLENYCDLWCLHINIDKTKAIEPGHEKMCLMSYANNKDADQPTHPRSLISAFVVHCLDGKISLDSIAEISSL